MGYANPEVFCGKTHTGADIYAGFRFPVAVAQGTTLTEAKLKVYLERMYPPSSVQAVLDTFTDENFTDLEAHTMDMGPAAGWLTVYGSAMILNNAVRSVLNAPQYSIVGSDLNANGTVMATATISGWGGGWSTRSGILFRYVDMQNYWIYYLATDGGASTVYERVTRVIGGSSVLLYGPGIATAPYTANLKVILDGNDIYCYRGGILSYSVTDAAHNDAVKHGNYTEISYGYIDNFEYIPPEPVGPWWPNLEAACDDVNDSDAWTASLPNARALTTARASLTGDLVNWDEDEWCWTVDIKAPIQEVLDRPGFVSGNHLSVILLPESGCDAGERIRVTAYEGSPSLAAILYLYY